MTDRDNVLTTWVVCLSPADFPGKFVVRGQDTVRGKRHPVPHAEAFVCSSLEEARAVIPRGLVCMTRDTASTGSPLTRSCSLTSGLGRQGASS